MVRALANGIEGKFKRPLERATALDVRYDHGNIPVVWAAYYLELPWPKRDRARAARELQRALRINPANLRARLYQARIAIDEDRPAEAKALLAEIAAAPVGRYDPPDERRVKKEAAALGAPASLAAAPRDELDHGPHDQADHGGASHHVQRAAIAPILRQLRVQERQREPHVGQHVVEAHRGAARLRRNARATSASPDVITMP